MSNITFYTPMLKLSGGNIVMFKYARSLVEFGHNVTVIAPYNEAIDEIKDGIHIKTFKKIPNKYFEHLFFQLIYLKNFYDLTPKSDVIIPIFFPLSLHAIYCKKKGKTNKIISLFQDNQNMFWFGAYIYFLIKQNFITKYIDKFFVVSKSIAEEIRRYTKEKTIVIQNGLEHEYFYPRDEKKENYILFVGSSSKIKGLNYFLKAFELVKKEYPDIKAKIVSQNNENINDKNIEVINVGNDRDKLAQLYSKALIYVSQSLNDSFGLPPLEAMACSTSVILTDTIGSREYAINNENCLIVPVKDYKATTLAIIDLLKNENKRLMLEKKGVLTARNFIWEKSFKRFNDEVNKVCNAQNK